METRHTNPDMNRDDMLRPDRAKHDEKGRTTTGRSMKPSPREQPAKSVSPEREMGGKREGKFMKESDEEFEEDEDTDTEPTEGQSHRRRRDDELH